MKRKIIIGFAALGILGICIAGGVVMYKNYHKPIDMSKVTKPQAREQVNDTDLYVDTPTDAAVKATPDYFISDDFELTGDWFLKQKGKWMVSFADSVGLPNDFSDYSEDTINNLLEKYKGLSFGEDTLIAFIPKDGTDLKDKILTVSVALGEGSSVKDRIKDSRIMIYLNRNGIGACIDKKVKVDSDDVAQLLLDTYGNPAENISFEVSQSTGLTKLMYWVYKYEDYSVIYNVYDQTKYYGITQVAQAIVVPNELIDNYVEVLKMSTTVTGEAISVE